jgi:hypothetical protein
VAPPRRPQAASGRIHHASPSPTPSPAPSPAPRGPYVCTPPPASPQQQQQQQSAALARAPPESVPPLLAGLLHGLPAGVAAFDMHPRPLLLPQMSGPAAAAAALEAAAEAASALRSPDTAGLGRLTYARREGSLPQRIPAQGQLAAAQGSRNDEGDASGGGPGGTGGVEAHQEVVLGAAGTLAGTLEVFVMHRGLVNPLAVEVGRQGARAAAGTGVCFAGRRLPARPSSGSAAAWLPACFHCKRRPAPPRAAHASPLARPTAALKRPLTHARARRRGPAPPRARSTQVALSLSVHKDAVRGVSWVGPLPLAASFSSERGQGAGGGWRNSAALTCLRTRRR